MKNVNHDTITTCDIDDGMIVMMTERVMKALNFMIWMMVMMVTFTCDNTEMLTATCVVNWLLRMSTH